MRILIAAPISTSELRKIGRDSGKLKNNYECFLLPLIRYLWEKGHEIVLIGTSREIKKNEEYFQDRLKIIIVGLWKHGRISALNDFREDIRRISKVIKKEECNIYHAHWCYEYAAACLKAKPKETLISMHDWPDKVCRLLGNYFWEKRRLLANKYMRIGRNFTAVSPYIKSELESVNPEANITLIPNYFNPEELSYFRENKSDPIEKKFTVICVNNGFKEVKNTINAMRAYEIFHKKNVNSTLCMYGDDYEKGGIAEKWAEANIDTDSISFEGKVGRRKIAEAFANADVLLHTSKEESFGLIYLEAMAGETAIIAGKESGATSWVLENGKDGILVDVDDIGEIVDSLDELYTDDKKRKSFIGNGSRRLRDFYSDIIFEKYLKMYEMMLIVN